MALTNLQRKLIKLPDGSGGTEGEKSLSVFTTNRLNEMTHNPNFNWPISKQHKLEKECCPIRIFMIGFGSASMLVIMAYMLCQMGG